MEQTPAVTTDAAAAAPAPPVAPPAAAAANSGARRVVREHFQHLATPSKACHRPGSLQQQPGPRVRCSRGRSLARVAGSAGRARPLGGVGADAGVAPDPEEADRASRQRQLQDQQRRFERPVTELMMTSSNTILIAVALFPAERPGVCRSPVQDRHRQLARHVHQDRPGHRLVHRAGGELNSRCWRPAGFGSRTCGRPAPRARRQVRARAVGRVPGVPRPGRGGQRRGGGGSSGRCA